MNRLPGCGGATPEFPPLKVVSVSVDIVYYITIRYGTLWWSRTSLFELPRLGLVTKYYGDRPGMSRFTGSSDQYYRLY